MDRRHTTTSRGRRRPDASPLATPESVTFRYLDDGDDLRAVSLVQEVVRPREGPPFHKAPDGLWEVRLPQPPVDRMEYRFELIHACESEEGSATLVLDPANPRVAPGAFGERSVVEFPEYSPPWWVEAGPAAVDRAPAGDGALAGDGAGGGLFELALPAPTLGAGSPAFSGRRPRRMRATSCRSSSCWTAWSSPGSPACLACSTGSSRRARCRPCERSSSIR